MAYEIQPYAGVGPIRFGMTRDEVRAVVTVEMQPAVDRGSSPPGDFFPSLGMIVHYRGDLGVCEFVEFGGPESPTFQGQSFLGQPYRHARSWLETRDPDLVVDNAGVKSPRFGIALYASAAEEEPDDPVEGIAIFEKGYYERRATDRERRLQEMARRYGVKVKF